MTDNKTTVGKVRRAWPDEYFEEDLLNHGVRCPECNCPRTSVQYTRHSIGKRNMRKRVCDYCGKSFPTWETTK